MSLNPEKKSVIADCMDVMAISYSEKFGKPPERATLEKVVEALIALPIDVLREIDDDSDKLFEVVKFDGDGSVLDDNPAENTGDSDKMRETIRRAVVQARSAGKPITIKMDSDGNVSL